MKVVGLDPSLRSTGVAEWVDGDTETHRVITSGTSRDSLKERCSRIRFISEQVADIAAGADMVVMEAPAYAARSANTVLLNGLWWLMAEALQREGIPTATAAPATLKKFATGRGNANKDEVMLSVVKKWGSAWDVTNNDVADAVALCAMGLAQVLGPEKWPVHGYEAECVEKVAWPEVEA